MKLLGGILLIIGTSIGGALLVLPVTNASAGFLYTSITMVSVWLLTLFTGLLLLEVNLWLPRNSNLISMAEFSLGLPGKLITWLAYLLLLYCLLSAYISGGADILAGLAARFNIATPMAINALIFTTLFGFFVYRGIKTIDYLNRALMLGKLGAYFLLVVLIIPHVDIHLLQGGNASGIVSSILYIVVSFGFAIIIPSLRSYFNDNISQLRLVIIIGTCIPLLCYILWTFVIMGVIPRFGENGLLVMLKRHYGPTDLVNSLAYSLNTDVITNIAHFFISVCILTAFFGISLSLVDFLADGLKINKQGQRGIWIYGITFIPSLLIAIIEPDTFRIGLRFAGIICVLLLILLPIGMVWRGRHVLHIKGSYQVFGGKITLSMATLAAIALFIFAVKETVMISP